MTSGETPSELVEQGKSAGIGSRFRLFVRDSGVHAAIASLAVVALGAVLAFLMFALIARELGPDEFGHFATWFNIVSFLAVGAALGQETFIGRTWNEHVGTGRLQLARGALLFGIRNLWLGSAVAVAGLLVAGLLLGVDRRVIAAACLFVIVQPTLSYVYQFTRGVIGNLKTDLCNELILRLGVIGVVLVALASGWAMGTAGVLSVLAGSAALVLVALILLVRPHVPEQVRRVEASQEREVWRARSLRMWVAAMLEASSQFLDIVLVGLLIGPVAAGGYFAASRIANMFAKVGTALEARAASSVSYLYFRRDLPELFAMLRALAIVSLVVVGIGLPVTLMLGKLLLPVFAEIYAQEFNTLAILAVGTAIVALSGPARLILLHTGEEGLYSRVIAWALVARIILFVALGLTLGTVGAAMAWTLSAVAASLYLNHACRQRIGVDPSVLILLKPSVAPRM